MRRQLTHLRTLQFLLVALLTLLASSMFAQNQSTVDNDSSCDIVVQPAATLLLPYFQVDLSDQRMRTTNFSITNVSPLPQIARVTLWTDWAFPALTFNIFLTGYDVQTVNLYDVIRRGTIPTTSTSSPNARTPTAETNPVPAAQPYTNLQNPNFRSTVVSNCAAGRQPGPLPANVAADLIGVLTTGRSSGSAITCGLANGQQAKVGSDHGANTAVGYLTVDVVADCTATGPTQLRYFTEDLLFDNVLTGDYEDIDTSAGVKNAGGNTMVHIRAVPEGGGAGSIPTGVTSLPFTFYDRLTVGAPDRRIDRRQPLPSTFAVRWVASDTPKLQTWFKIWREPLFGGNPSCDMYAGAELTPITETVRFDERENAAVNGSGVPYIVESSPTLRPASFINSNNSLISPALATTDSGGWLYMNLSNGGETWPQPRPYSSSRPGYSGPFQPRGQRDVSQNWVTTSMSAEGRFHVEIDATMLGNGCTPAAPSTNSGGQIAPVGGVVVCPPGTLPTNGDATACRGSNINP